MNSFYLPHSEKNASFVKWTNFQFTSAASAWKIAPCGSHNILTPQICLDLGKERKAPKFFKRATFLFSFFLVSVNLQRVLVSSSPNAYGFIFFSFSVLVHPYQVHMSHTTFFIYIYIYIYILRCALCFCEFCAFVYPTKRKEFSVLVFIQGSALSSWRKIGLFSESFHVITWSLVSFHDFFVWVPFILFFLSVLDKFLWICLYFFDGRWLCLLRRVNILVRRAVKLLWIVLELVGKFWSLFKF